MSSLVRVCATVFLFYACGMYGSHMTTKAADACAQALRALERKMLKRFDKLEDGVSKCWRPPPKGKWSHFSRWWKFFKTDLDELFQFYLIFSQKRMPPVGKFTWVTIFTSKSNQSSKSLLPSCQLVVCARNPWETRRHSLIADFSNLEKLIIVSTHWSVICFFCLKKESYRIWIEVWSLRSTGFLTNYYFKNSFMKNGGFCYLQFWVRTLLYENVLVHSKTRALKNLGEQQQFGVSFVACSGISSSTRF